jgi:hypothetical protein
VGNHAEMNVSPHNLIKAEASFPFFGKHLEKAECLAWKAKIIIKAKEKKILTDKGKER